MSKVIRGGSQGQTYGDTERADKARSATRGAFFAEFVDMFDIYLPTVVLTPALIYFKPVQLSPALAGILTSLVFATTLVGRPIGAAIFGALSDRIGRRKSTSLPYLPLRSLPCLSRSSPATRRSGSPPTRCLSPCVSWMAYASAEGTPGLSL